jgi:DNA repair exonuclease SbcCD ATPase subunit
LNGQHKSNEENSSNLREEIERLKRDLKKSESIENELRRTVDEHVREKNDLQTAKEQVQYSVGNMSFNNFN